MPDNENIIKNATEQEQQELSYLLDRFTIWYENYFDEDAEIFEDSFNYFERLYSLVKDLEDKI